jgi:hypothetical protein
MEILTEELKAKIEEERLRRKMSGRVLSRWPENIREALVALVRSGHGPRRVSEESGISGSLLRDWAFGKKKAKLKKKEAGDFQRLLLKEEPRRRGPGRPPGAGNGFKHREQELVEVERIVLRYQGYEVHGLSTKQLREFFCDV